MGHKGVRKRMEQEPFKDSGKKGKFQYVAERGKSFRRRRKKKESGKNCGGAEQRK